MLVTKEKTHVINSDVLINPGGGAEHFAKGGGGGVLDWQAEFACFP